MPIDMLIMFVVMLAVVYFFMIRPESKRKKDAENLRSSLSVGDNVTTIGGLTGTICKVDENTIVFETGADRVRIEVTKWAVSTKNAAPTITPPSKTPHGRRYKPAPPTNPPPEIARFQGFFSAFVGK